MNRLLRSCSRLRWWLLVPGLLNGIGAETEAAEGKSETVAIRSVEVGIGGWIKVGKWAPLVVSLETSGPADVQLRITTRDPAGYSASYVSPRRQLSQPGRHLLKGRFQPGGLGGEILVQVDQGKRQGDERTIRISQAPDQPARWRMQDVTADHVVIPVRRGQRLVFFQDDRFAPHGLRFTDPRRIQRIRSPSGSDVVLKEISSASSTDPSRLGHERKILAEFEVVETPRTPLFFFDSEASSVLTGQIVAGGAESGEDTSLTEATIEIAVEGSPVSLPQSRRLWATWGRPAGFGTTPPERTGSGRTLSAQLPVVAAFSEFSDLSDSTSGLDAVDGIVIASGRDDVRKHPRHDTSVMVPVPYGVDEVQSQVLCNWVAQGGHLFVSVGRDREAWTRSPLAKWVPIRMTKTRQLSDSDLRGLETYSNRSVRIPFLGRVPGSVLTPSDGRTFGTALSGPLLAESVYGMGRVTVLAVDLDHPPLSDWNALPALIERVLVEETSESAKGGGTGSGALVHSGISDLKTQLHAIQDDFPRVRRLAIWQVMVLLVGFLVLVGPLDYLLVHKVFKQPRLTWVTLPITIALVIGIATWASGATNRRDLLVNQLDVLDIDTVTARSAVHTWATVYSADSQRYDVQLQPAEWVREGEVLESQIGWSGIPETSFGGMYRDNQSVALETGYQIEEQDSRKRPVTPRIKGLPIAIWSTRTVSASWQAKAPSLVKSSLSSTGVGQLSGQIEHHLPGEIDDWLLAYENRVFRAERNKRLAQLRPGVPLSTRSSQVRARALKEFLTGTSARRVARKGGGYGTDVRTSQVRYDALNRDPADLLQMLTFHRAAGGRLYTGLENHALDRLDLSSLLPLDRAVLLGRLITRQTPGARIAINGRPVKDDQLQVIAFVRIVLPVKRKARIRRRILDPSE